MGSDGLVPGDLVGALPLGALLGGIVGQAFGLTAVFIGAAVIHLCPLPSRLILTDAFMARVEAHAAKTATAETAAAETAAAETAAAETAAAETAAAETAR